MTREELVQMREYKVGAASTEYWNKNKDNDEVGIMTAFEDGVAWADEHPKNPWISLSERVPEPKKRVLFLDNKGVAHFGYNNIDRKGATIFTTDANAPVITHWMPIPTLNPAEQLISGLQEMNKQFEKGGK